MSMMVIVICLRSPMCAVNRHRNVVSLFLPKFQRVIVYICNYD